MIFADQFAVAAAQRRAIGAGGKAEQLHRVMFLARQAGIGRLAPRFVHPLPEARAECVHRILEIGPARRQVGAARGAESAAFGFPAGGRRDRKTAGSGKSVAGRLTLGGPRYLTKKKTSNYRTNIL